MKKIKCLESLSFSVFLLVLSLLCSIADAPARQYNVKSYYKVEYNNDMECRNYYTYQNGKEIYINTVCFTK
jgi:hypothetical protein